MTKKEFVEDIATRGEYTKKEAEKIAQNNLIESQKKEFISKLKMTNEEKFRAGTVVYKDDDGDYVCELWEASTRHPDVIYHMNADGKYKKSGLYDDDKYEVFQWLLSIAGDLTFRFHAWSLAQYALREWYQVDD